MTSKTQPRPARNGKPGQQTRQERDRGRSAAEWTTLAVSSAIVLLLAGLLVFWQLTGEAQPATIEVQPRLQAVRQEGGLYYLPVEIENRGDRTAADVRVVLSLQAGQPEEESAEVMVSFLAGAERERAVVTFQQDPRSGSLRVRHLSFLEP